MKSTHDELVESMLADIEQVESGLSGWEIDFIGSISDQYEQGKALTDRQMAKLKEIWEDKT